jgi:hypothetical protein
VKNDYYFIVEKRRKIMMDLSLLEQAAQDVYGKSVDVMKVREKSELSLKQYLSNSNLVPANYGEIIRLT